MIKAIGLALAFCLFFDPGVVRAKKGFMTHEQMVAQWVTQNLLTKDQAIALKSSIFLVSRCTNDKFSSCRPAVNFGIDCGVTASVEVENVRYRFFLTRDLALLGTRVTEYPTVLKTFGKWDATAEQRLAELKQAYDTGVLIANENATPISRLREAKPVLEKADKISRDMANAAGFDYDGGCGAGDDDSQIVDFTLSEKPKSAFYILQMDFDACKHILRDPYDPSKCDAWARISSKSNALSGNYRYRVTWSDGTVAEQPFKALSTGKKTIEINK